MSSHEKHAFIESDDALLREVCSGCTECFSALFHRYCRGVFSIANRILRDPREAEDILQEVFLAIFQQQEKYDASRGSVRTWILQFAYFKALVRRRYLRIRNFYKQEELQQVDEFGISVAHGDIFGMNESEWRHFIERGLAELTKPQRRAIELIHIEGMTLAETSEALRETLANTRNHYYRGLNALRAFLSEQAVAKRVEERKAIERDGVYRFQS